MSINVSEIPQIDGDLDAVDSAGDDLKTAGTKFAQTGADVNTTWQGLSAVYSAPESGDLLRATQPVSTDSSSIGTDVGTVGSALIAYAAEVRPIKAQLAQLKLDAGSFNADISGDDDWRKDGDKVNEQNRILKAVNAAVAAWQAAERTCANAINSTYGGTQYHADDGQGQPSANEYGYDVALLDGATASDQGVPWGKAAERDKPWYEDAWDGVVSFGKGLFVDGLWGAVRSLGTLVGVNGVDAMGQAWVGVGKLALALNPTMLVLDATVGVPGMKRGELGETLLNTGKALIAYDMWGQDPARAAGAVTGNIIGAVIGTKGAGMAVKSAGAAVKAVEVGGKAAQLVGRGLQGIGSTMVKVSDLKISLQTNMTKGLMTRLDNLIPKPALAGASNVGRHQFDVIPGRPGGGASTMARIGDDVPSSRAGSGSGAHDTVPGRGSGGGGSPARLGDDGAPSRGGSGSHGDPVPERGGHPARVDNPSGSRPDGEGVSRKPADGQPQGAPHPSGPDSSTRPHDAGSTGTTGIDDPRAAGERPATGSSGSSPDTSHSGPSHDAPSNRGGSSQVDKPSVDHHVDVTDEPGKRTAFSARTDLAPRTEYQVQGRGTFITDDHGRVTHVETSSGQRGAWNPELMEPRPNATYVVDDRFVFRTDELARTTHIHADRLELDPRVDTSDRRHGSLQAKVGHEGGPGYEGGHGAGTKFYGPGERINLAAQLRELNRGAGDSFGNLEGKWRRLLGDDPSTKISYDLYYDFPKGGGDVPTTMAVDHVIDGVSQRQKVFNNVRGS